MCHNSLKQAPANGHLLSTYSAKGNSEINHQTIVWFLRGQIPKLELLNQSLYTFKTLIHLVFLKC